jgi:hypothetical protein
VLLLMVLWSLMTLTAAVISGASGGSRISRRGPEAGSTLAPDTEAIVTSWMSGPGLLVADVLPGCEDRTEGFPWPIWLRG